MKSRFKKLFEIVIDFIVVLLTQALLSYLTAKFAFLAVLTSDQIWKISAIVGIIFAECYHFSITRKN